MAKIAKGSLPGGTGTLQGLAGAGYPKILHTFKFCIHLKVRKVGLVCHDHWCQEARLVTHVLEDEKLAGRLVATDRPDFSRQNNET